MKILKNIIILFFTFGLLSCDDYTTYSDEDCINYDYSDCNSTEPFYGFVNVQLTINKQNPEVELVVFDGNIENHDTIAHDTIDQPFFQIFVELNKTYSAIAKYKVNDNRVIAVGNDKIRKTSATVCDSVCWKIKGGNIDVRLKYDDL